MILLTSTSDAIQIVTGAAVNSINVQASWVDLNGTTMIPGRTNTLISSATTTTVIAPPAANTERSMKNLSIYNSDDLYNCLITIQHYDGTTLAKMFSYEIPPSESIHWSEGRGWYVLDNQGNLKTVVTATTPSIDFENVTSGTNISADMVVGTGAILEYSGTGQINASGIILLLEAGQNIGAYQAVAVHGDGLAYLADAGTIADAGRMVGIAITSALTGDTVKVQQVGTTQNNGWSWTPGEQIYLGLIGALTQTLNVGVFQLPIGIALAAQEIEVEIGLPIVFS